MTILRFSGHMALWLAFFYLQLSTGVPLARFGKVASSSWSPVQGGLQDQPIAGPDQHVPRVLFKDGKAWTGWEPADNEQGGSSSSLSSAARLVLENFPDASEMSSGSGELEEEESKDSLGLSDVARAVARAVASHETKTTFSSNPMNSNREQGPFAELNLSSEGSVSESQFASMMAPPQIEGVHAANGIRSASVDEAANKLAWERRKTGEAGVGAKTPSAEAASTEAAAQAAKEKAAAEAAKKAAAEAAKKKAARNKAAAEAAKKAAAEAAKEKAAAQAAKEKAAAQAAKKAAAEAAKEKAAAEAAKKAAAEAAKEKAAAEAAKKAAAEAAKKAAAEAAKEKAAAEAAKKKSADVVEATAGADCKACKKKVKILTKKLKMSPGMLGKLAVAANKEKNAADKQMQLATRELKKARNRRARAVKAATKAKMLLAKIINPAAFLKSFG